MQKEVGFNLVEVTRDEWEAKRTDSHRFDQPGDYMEKESLQYFKDDFFRRLFVEWYYDGQVLSNVSLLKLAKVSSPFQNIQRKVNTPVLNTFEMHRQKYIQSGTTEYNLHESITCRLYHLCLTLIAAKVKLNFLNSSSDDLNEYFDKTIKHKMSKHG